MEPQIVTMKVKMGQRRLPINFLFNFRQDDVSHSWCAYRTLSGEAMKTQFKYKHVRPANDPAAVNVQVRQTSFYSTEIKDQLVISVATLRASGASAC